MEGACLGRGLQSSLFCSVPDSRLLKEEVPVRPSVCKGPAGPGRSHPASSSPHKASNPENAPLWAGAPAQTCSGPRASRSNHYGHALLALLARSSGYPHPCESWEQVWAGGGRKAREQEGPCEGPLPGEEAQTPAPPSSSPRLRDLGAPAPQDSVSPAEALPCPRTSQVWEGMPCGLGRQATTHTLLPRWHPLPLKPIATSPPPFRRISEGRTESKKQDQQQRPGSQALRR